MTYHKPLKPKYLWKFPAPVKRTLVQLGVDQGAKDKKCAPDKWAQFSNTELWDLARRRGVELTMGNVFDRGLLVKQLEKL